MSGLLALAATLPQCAIPCLIDAIGNSSCEITDESCVCNDPNINIQATSCIRENCTVREALSTKNLTSTSCGIVPNTGPSYVPIFMTFTALCAVSVSLRVVARLKAGYPVWWDDFIITLSFLACVAFTTIAWKSKYIEIVRELDLGTDIWAIPFDNITTIFKTLYALFVLYITSRHLVRGSILLFYYRLFGHDRLARRLVKISFGMLIAFGTAFDCAILFGCTPIQHFWLSWDGQHNGHCISTHAIFWAGAIIDILIDLWIMLIPIPFIIKLKLSLRKRILTGIMFAFGIFVTVVSLYRLTMIDRFTLSQNPTADFLDVGTWSGLELYVGIICACLPNLNSLLKPVYAWMGSRTQASRPGGNDSVDGSGQQHRGHDEEHFDLGRGIRATTVIDVEEHSSDGGSLSIERGRGGLGQSGTAFRMQDIELGTTTQGGTCGRAWI